MNTPAPIRRIVEPRLPGYGVQRTMVPDILVYQEVRDVPWAGLTRHGGGMDTEVYIIEGYDNTIPGYTVMAHELLHAIGYGPHIARGGTYLSTTPRMDMGEPCAEVAGWVRKAQGQFRVWVQDDELNDEASWAVALWNSTAGRELFILSYAP